jgi:hemerythrin
MSISIGITNLHCHQQDKSKLNEELEECLWKPSYIRVHVYTQRNETLVIVLSSMMNEADWSYAQFDSSMDVLVRGNKYDESNAKHSD